MAREYRDIWNEPDEPSDEPDAKEYEYLDRERHDHGLELWNLAGIFEPLRPGEDTRYQDFHLSIVNNWKVIIFDVGRWDVSGAMTIDINMFAVRR